MGPIRQWWNQPDHYQWLSGYLAYRNARDFTRKMMGLIVVVLGVVPALMIFSPSGPPSTLGRAISVVVVACCAAMAAVWFTRWPSKRESVAFAIVSNLSIAAICLVWPNPLTGLLGCMSFAALAGYVAVFHTSYYLLMVLATAALTAIDCTVEIARAGDPYLAVVSFLMVTVGVLAVPFSAQVLVHLLGGDAVQSHNDPLTGLHNRRGFYRSVRDLIGPTTQQGPPYLTVAMVDLDRFKQINDTRGHATGDRLLVAVGASLQQVTGEKAVVARVGGEEFLVAEVTHDDGADAMAERLRLAVEATSEDVTASVGVACGALDGNDVVNRAVVKALVEAADNAMYEAKRSGGNRSRRA